MGCQDYGSVSEFGLTPARGRELNKHSEVYFQRYGLGESAGRQDLLFRKQVRAINRLMGE